MKFKKMMKLTVFNSVFIPLIIGSVIQAEAFTSYELDSDLNYKYTGAKAPEFYKNTTVAYSYKGTMPQYINDMYGTSNQDVYNSNFGSNIIGLNGYGNTIGSTYGYGYGMNYDNYISSVEGNYFDSVAGGGSSYNVNVGGGNVGVITGAGTSARTNAGNDILNNNANTDNSNLIINYTDNANNTQNQISGVLPNEVGDVVFPSYFADTNNSYTSSNKDVQLDRYSDGKIGTIKIKNADLDVKAYDYSDIYQSMKKGVGHLDSTAYWNGNAVFFGHNRGSNGYFSRLKNVEVGDIVEYTTKEGTKKYKVDTVKQIDQTDWSDIGYSSTNKITLITCVANKPNLRLLVQGYEVD